MAGMDAQQDADSGKRKPARARILDAAGALFDAHGYHGTSTDMIQAAANVSKSTLYRHFATKETLFEVAMEEGGRRFLTLVGGLSRVPDVERFLTAFGMEFIDALLSPHSLDRFRLMMMESQRFPDLGRAFYLGGPKGVVDLVHDYLVEASARGEVRLRDPHVAAEQYVSMIRGEVHLRALLGLQPALTPAEKRRHVEACVATFLDACRPRGVMDRPMLDSFARSP